MPNCRLGSFAFNKPSSFGNPKKIKNVLNFKEKKKKPTNKINFQVKEKP